MTGQLPHSNHMLSLTLAHWHREMDSAYYLKRASSTRCRVVACAPRPHEKILTNVCNTKTRHFAFVNRIVTIISSSTRSSI